MTTAGQPILASPTIPSIERCALRFALTEEENKELKEAYEDGDLVEVFDALLDKLFVVLGDFNEFGMAHMLETGFDEVTRSNLSKFCTSKEEAEATIVSLLETFPSQKYHFEEVGKYFVVKNSTTGKIMKSINYSPADLKTIVEKALPQHSQDGEESNG